MNARSRKQTSRIMAICIAVFILVLGVVFLNHKSTSQQQQQQVIGQPAGNDLNTLQNPALAYRAEQIVSSFENSSLTINYTYAENLNDGRGLTVGRAGFTSGNGDLLEVIQKYTELEPMNPLVKYVPALHNSYNSLRDRGVVTTSGLENFAREWTQTAKTDKQLRNAQDFVYNKEYFNPAIRHADALGIKTSVGQLVLLDTIIQHGNGDDQDGLPAIIAKTISQVGPINNNEQDWLKAFLENRRADLTNPADTASTDGWRKSVDRVNALESIIGSHNPTLQKAISWTVYDDKYSLPALK